MRRATHIIVLALLALALSACSAARTSDSATSSGAGATGASAGSSSARPNSTSAVTGDPSAVTALAPSEKRAAISADFPAEVPAPMGVYTDVVSQGGNAWDYRVQVDARGADLMSWYRQAYTGRSWQLVDEGQYDGESDSGTYATFRKGSAETNVKVQGDPASRPARAFVTVGVGAAVLETQ